MKFIKKIKEYLEPYNEYECCNNCLYNSDCLCCTGCLNLVDLKDWIK